ncbi:hypothetical protein ACHAXM_011756 [Skeletonema potamos]
MPDHPAVVTIKAFSSGTHASIVNVMTVISKPESTTLRTVIASEIKSANPSLGFDDAKQIAAVETKEETNIKQLLDLPMSILLKQQVGIRDGVIHVTVDTPSPMKPPAHASSKRHTVTNNKSRMNPFIDSSRENFPPLEEFFRNEPSETHTNSSSRQSMHRSARSFTSICNDFSLDMSIAGQAAMAHHRYQIEKYGIDGDKLNKNNDEDISPLSEEKDWDRIMDSNFSPCNQSITFSTSRMLCESQILSPSNLTEVSDSYFDKSVIEALKTPEKHSGGNTSIEQPICGVILSRGNDNLDYSDDENSILGSPDASTHVTNTSGLNGIFRAAMRLHNDLDKNSTRSDENESTVSTNDVFSSRKGSKSLSVSFAGDESFVIEHDSSSTKKIQRNCDDDEEMDEFGDFLLSPICKENKDVTFCVDSSFIAHQSSPCCSCVKNSCLNSPGVSPGSSGEMTKTPLARQMLSTSLIWPNNPSPEQKKNAILRSKSMDECFRRKLQFDSPNPKGAVSEIGAFDKENAPPSAKDNEFSSRIVRRSSSASSLDKQGGERLSRNDTQTTLPLEESSFESQKENRSIPSNGGRLFGSDATSRLNSQTRKTHSINKPNSAGSSTGRSYASENSSKSANRKESGSFGVLRLIEVSFEMIDKACSSGAQMPSSADDIGSRSCIG